jgi:hypothetical protein
MILADELPPITSLWNLLPLVLTALMAIGTWGLYWNSRKNTRTEVLPSPLVVKGEDDFVHKVEFQKYMAEQGRQISELRSERRTDNNILHEKINSVDRKVAGLEAATDIQNQKLVSMDAKLDRLIERK